MASRPGRSMHYDSQALNAAMYHLAVALGKASATGPSSFRGSVGQLVGEIIAERDRLRAEVGRLQAINAALADQVGQLRASQAGTAGLAESTCDTCRQLVRGRSAYTQGALLAVMTWTHVVAPAEPHAATVTPIVMEFGGDRVETWPLPPPV